MAAAKYDTEIVQGATFHRVIRYRDPTGAAIDLTGARVLFQVRKSADDATSFLDFDSDSLQTGMTCGALDDTGTIDFTVSGDLTALLDFRSAVWDLFVVFDGGEDDCLFEGKLNLRRAVTRWR